MKLGPVTFLFAVAIGWATVRALWLWPEAGPAQPERAVRWQPPLVRTVDQATAAPPIEARMSDRISATARAIHTVLPAAPEQVPVSIAQEPARPALATPWAAASPVHSPPFAPTGRASDTRLALSAWAILRGAGDTSLATGGQLGGSQAGVRVRYAVLPGLALAARVSGPVRSRLGKEAAVAMDLRPIADLPLTVTIERRAGLDSGGRDAFAAGVFGGLDSVPLPLGARLDGYGQAGIVGLKTRDLYADGAVRLEKPAMVLGRTSLAAGGGVWGAAQPGVSRLDVGPQIVARIPAPSGGVRIAAEWRQRIAGNARPGSGPTLSIGADF